MYQNGKNIPNDYKIYLIAIEYTKCPQNIHNCHKLFKMAVKYTNIFHPKYTRIGIFGTDIYHLATLVLGRVRSRRETSMVMTQKSSPIFLPVTLHQNLMKSFGFQGQQKRVCHASHHHQRKEHRNPRSIFEKRENFFQLISTLFS
jgi:hypothetical protein